MNYVLEETKIKVRRISVQSQREARNLPPVPSNMRVCAYCRVSTDEEDQVSSYELQVNHYTQFIQCNDQWEFAGIYADYGRSGTSTKKRTEFLRMIEDCREGKIDLVITKSISRFTRNTLDCLNYVRELKYLTPPVGIYFEKENINTLDSKSELLLTILSSLAQDEARSISENMKWSIQKQFQAGKARCPTKFLLGYVQDKNGKLMIDEEEAETVRRVYLDYMEGKGAKLIASELKAEKVISGRGTTNWGKNSILHMLRNEKYCGDVLMQKSFTVDFLTHKKKENRGELPQYYIENHHPAIIPREEWTAVQAEIKRRHEIATTKDHNIRQGYSNVSVISNHLFCGHCGQQVIRHSAILTSGGKKENISVWRCRATKGYIRGGYERCAARRHQDPKMKEAFMEMLLNLKKRKLEMSLGEENEILIEILNSLEDGAEFKDEYFKKLVERGEVYDDGKIEYTLKCGFTCTSYIKNEKRHPARKVTAQTLGNY